MSKKHPGKLFSDASAAAAGNPQAAEYRVIKHDLIKVVILNAVYLAVVLSLYYANRGSGVVDAWFARVLHF